jgi:hypothetical protein
MDHSNIWYSRFGENMTFNRRRNPGKYATVNNPKMEAALSTIRAAQLTAGKYHSLLQVEWEGNMITRVWLLSSKALQVETFMAPSESLLDYYLVVEAPIDSRGFFTDSNGLLVAARNLSSHEDYTAFDDHGS